MSNESQPLVSIVTPVYNEERYLAECVESILAQRYTNWDYTILNNASTDRTGEIARRYAWKDKRIRVVENPTCLPAIANHNAALRQISLDSKYCKVVFGDDWVFPDCLRCMVEVGEAHPSVGIIGAYGLEGSLVKWAGLDYPSTVISGRDICRRLFLDSLYVFGSATSLMYRADLVRARDPFFNEANIHCDMEICVSLLKSCDFGFVHQILTYTRPEEPGCMRSYSAELNTYAAGRLHNLVTFGPEYLNPQEYQACLDKMITEYYGTLVGGMLRGHDKGFWKFHKQKLTEAGIGLSLGRLSRVALAKSFDAILNPKVTAEKALEIGRELSSRRRRRAVQMDQAGSAKRLTRKVVAP